jgi:hypothetical protein
MKVTIEHEGATLSLDVPLGLTLSDAVNILVIPALIAAGYNPQSVNDLILGD